MGPLPRRAFSAVGTRPTTQTRVSQSRASRQSKQGRVVTVPQTSRAIAAASRSPAARIDHGNPKQPDKPIAWLWKFIVGPL
jgi:hypothetical protein